MSDITCRCGARWSGVTRAHCSACHETFASVRLFEAHRRADSCLSPRDLNLTWDGRLWRDRAETERLRKRLPLERKP